MPKPSRPPRTSPLLIIILGVAVAGSTLAIAQRSGDYRFFDPLIEVKNIIAKYAVEEPDLDQLQRAALDGMIEALDDPYALYVPPQVSDEFEKQLTGEYVGIGAEVNNVDGVFTIITPMDDSPAFRAGLMAGDKVRKIDGESTEGLSVDEAIDRLVGEAGTSVTLTVERGGETLEITITRAHIKARAVRGYQRSSDEEHSWEYTLDPERHIGYIRISQFTPSAAAEFADALGRLGAASGDLNGLVIDARWNPGGLLDQAVRIADMFIDEGIIVSTNGRAYDEHVYRATEPGTLPDFPVAVLVNAQSASASEVLAGALLENGRAIVVGERTFGKGSVQSVHPLGGGATGASIKLTEQRYYLPSGRSLQRTDDSPEWGVDPSPGYFIPVDDEELVELLRVRRQAEIIRDGTDPQDRQATPGELADPSRIVEILKDRQLAAAVRALREHIATGEWPQIEESDKQTDTALSIRELRRLELARERMLRELARVDRRIEAVESVAEEPDRAQWDLWPDETPIEGGQVVVRGPDGEVLATLRITGPNLERWLIDADVEPQ